MALSGLFAVVAMWGGLALSYAISSLPPSSAVIGLAAGSYVAASAFAWMRRRRAPSRSLTSAAAS
jgi:ABC-type Mn2+/Zn2+ transport system permease subunit